MDINKIIDEIEEFSETQVDLDNYIYNSEEYEEYDDLLDDLDCHLGFNLDEDDDYFY